MRHFKLRYVIYLLFILESLYIFKTINKSSFIYCEAPGYARVHQELIYNIYLLNKISSIFQKENPKLTSFESDVYAYALLKAAYQFDIKPEILLRLIKKESSFNPYAKSSAGAYGFTQIMASVWGYRPKELYNGVFNIYLGAKILSEYIGVYGDYKTALIKYSGGAGPHYYCFILDSVHYYSINWRCVR